MSNLPKLTAIQSHWMKELMAHPDFVAELLAEYGSPINIHHLPTFDDNIENFKEVFKKNNVTAKIFYARKANKSKFLIKRAKENGIGVDTASFNELKQTIESGLESSHIVLTAAVKNDELITYAIENDVLIILDNHDEIKQTKRIAQQLNKAANVGFRLSGFKNNELKLYSRFGFDIENLVKIIVENVTANSKLKYKGLHFHLDGYSTEQRAKAILQTLELIGELNKHDISTQFIDIGGGILINYLKEKEGWENFIWHLKEAVLNKATPITFDNHGLGFQNINNQIYGQLKTYPFYNEINKSAFLQQILSYKNDSHRSIAQLLNDFSIELRIEPGRSLLDQVGVTIAKVAFRKKDARNNLLIGLEMNMSQLSSSSEDFLLDPLVIYKNKEGLETESEVEGYLVGAYCLERDFILKRKLSFKRLPEIGDMVLFVNTAGYMMHFFETEAHLFNLSTNLALKDKTIDFKLSQIISDED